MNIQKRILAAALAVTFLGISGCNKPAGSDSGTSPAGGAGKPKGKLKIAYVTNGIDPFWNNASAGVRAAEKEFDVQCEVLMPPKGIVDQKRMIETLLVNGIDGIAIR